MDESERWPLSVLVQRWAGAREAEPVREMMHMTTTVAYDLGSTHMLERHDCERREDKKDGGSGKEAKAQAKQSRGSR